jgi:exopolyphosphatase / guanosine-5'-triphosphate,3'-diphosphate pyrophosphatase
VISAAMPGVLTETSLAIERHRLALRMPGDFSALAGERVLNRLRSLARLIGREPVLLMG